MERLVEIKVAKFNILSIFHCYYRLFPLIYIRYDSEGMTIQGSCKEWRVLVTTTIPQDSFGSYEFRGLGPLHGGGKPMILAVPHHIRELGVDVLVSVF